MNVAVRAPPPERLQPVRSVRWAEHRLKEPDFAGPPYANDTEARKAGRRYENKVQEYLLKKFPLSYVASPWIRFCDPSRQQQVSWCQPDGWFIDFRRGLIVIVEIKLSHTADAWWQVRHLYEPVTRFLFGPDWRYAACEITKWYDPQVNFPENPTMAPQLDTLWAGAFGIHVWRPL
jgi:hypothetical protein